MATSQGRHPVSRISQSSERTVGAAHLSNGNGRHHAPEEATAPPKGLAQYSISTVLADPNAPASLLPALPSLASNSFLPTSLSSLGTTFTSAGTLPRSSTASKSVAQRRSQAPPIVVSEVRKVARSEFDEYLNEVGPAWERWQAESRLGWEGSPDMRENEGVGLGLGEMDDGNSRPRRKEEQLPPLDGVPQIFFDPSFNLSNPRTFDLVTERIQMTPSNSPKLRQGDYDPLDHPGDSSFDPIPGLGPLTLNDLATDQILQEKLSHYTAVIESHLVREIGLRSSSFFSALSNLQSLHQQGEDTLAKIAELQAALSEEEKGVGATAKHGLEIVRGQARRRGLEKIEESVRAVEEIWSGVEAVKEMVEHGEWVGALEVAEQIETMYHGSAEGEDMNGLLVLSPAIVDSPSTATSSPTTATPKRRSRHTKLNLTRVKALDGVPKKLALLRSQVAKSLESELIGVLEHELETGVDDFRRLSVKGTWKGKARQDSTAFLPPSSTTIPSAARSIDAIVDGAAEEGPAAEGEAGEDVAKERAKERVRPVIRGLVRADGMDGAVAAWRESALREVRAMVREYLPTNETPSLEEEDHFAQLAVRSVSRSSIDLNSISEKSISLAKKLRGLPHAAFLDLARQTYLGLLGCIEVVDLHAHVLVELVDQARAEERRRRKARRRSNTNGDDSRPSTPNGSSLLVPGQRDERSALSLAAETPSTPATPSDESTATDILDVVHAIAELANLRFSKVIGVRTEVHAALDLPEFVEIFDASWAFVLQCEVICQRMIVGLRGVMAGQAKTFLQTFHQKRLTDSARLVENEQWVAADVKPSTQSAVNLILQGATQDPLELLLGQRAKDKGPQQPQAISSDEEAATAKQVDIEGRRYFAVSAGLTALETLIDYVKVIVNCPLLTTDAMSKIVEFMKSFNSRTCQVVLGAGAMRSAGLKNITAKHLALASQALSIMISLIPYIRETIRRHLSPKQAVMLIEFDKLKRDYQEHQNEIHSKLVAIMSDRLHVHCRTLESINWEQPGPKPDGPNAYMEGLVKENITLHKVLARFLQPETVEFIMGQVFAALDSRLTDEYDKIELKSEEARGRLLTDAIFLRTKLGELKGLEAKAPGQGFESLIRFKSVPEAPARPPTNRRTSSTTAVFSASDSPSLAPSPAPGPSSARTSLDTPDLSALPSPSVTPAPAPVAIGAEPPLPALPNDSPALPTVQELSSPVASPTSPPPPSVPASPIIVAPQATEVSLEHPPPKKKTLAERLAEMAKRRTGHAPAAVPAPQSAAAVVSPRPSMEVQPEPSPRPSEDKPAESSTVPVVNVEDVQKPEAVPSVAPSEVKKAEEPTEAEDNPVVTPQEFTASVPIKQEVLKPSEEVAATAVDSPATPPATSDEPIGVEGPSPDEATRMAEEESTFEGAAVEEPAAQEEVKALPIDEAVAESTSEPVASAEEIKEAAASATTTESSPPIPQPAEEEEPSKTAPSSPTLEAESRTIEELAVADVIEHEEVDEEESSFL